MVSLCPVSYTHLDVYKRQVLDSNEFEAEVRADEAEAESKEIGTPYTIINGEKGEFIVNGAQDGVMFVKALKDATGIN